MRTKAARFTTEGTDKSELADPLGSGLPLLDGSIRFYPTIQRCKNTVFKDFRLSLKPVFQFLPLFLASRFVKLLGARPHLSLDQAYHQGLLFLSTCFDVQPNAPYV
jgi:hypothetical protein